MRDSLLLQGDTTKVARASSRTSRSGGSILKPGVGNVVEPNSPRLSFADKCAPARSNQRASAAHTLSLPVFPPAPPAPPARPRASADVCLPCLLAAKVKPSRMCRSFLRGGGQGPTARRRTHVPNAPRLTVAVGAGCCSH
jgi:hypothetical protein